MAGATGYIGAQVVQEALAAGLRVRAVCRTSEKADKMVSSYASSPHKAQLETALVPDMFTEGAFDEAIKGCKGVAHVANVMTFTDKWDEVVEPTVAGVLCALEAAHKAGGVTRFVLTSSSVTLGWPQPPSALQGRAPSATWTVEQWNDAGAEEARSKPSGWNIYTASKVLGERAAWDFVKKNKPGFKLTTVLPNANFGHEHPAATTTSTAGWLDTIGRDGDFSTAKKASSQYFVNVTDDARLHVAGLTREDVGEERIAAFTSAFSWRDVDAALAAAGVPTHKAGVAEKEYNGQDWFEERDLTKVDTRRMKEVLGGEEYVADLVQTVKEQFGLAEVHKASPLIAAK